MKYYCLGIKGAGMSTLACILYDLGFEVIGYDDTIEHKFTEEGLEKRNIKIYHDDSFELDDNTIVTYSVALSLEHKELVRAKGSKAKIVKYCDILGEITRMFDTISVCGTHGKTTTSSLIKHILDQYINVNYFIGDGTGHCDKENKLFVIESDEFNRHFLSYSPKYTVITNIELEHTEIYRDLDDIIETFQTFANKTEKLIVACGDNPNVRKIKTDKQIIYYGFNEDNDAYAKNVELTDTGSNFDMYINNEFYSHFELPLFGKHMVLNAMAAILICINQNFQKEMIEEAIKTFVNAKRRFNIENIKENVIIDDYAHHPTEIKVTLEAARQKYPDKELIAVFKPNTYSRTQRFYSDFADSLNIADKVYLTEIECNREKKEDYGNVTSKVIFDLLNNGEMISDNEITSLLKHKNAVICFMSCASVKHLIENYKQGYGE